jgi:uncharacterized protein YwgA
MVVEKMLGFLKINTTEGFGKELLQYILNETIEKRKWDCISRLQVIKILYLLEKEFKKKTGTKLSKYIFIKHRLGPYSGDIVSDLEDLKNAGILANVNIYYSYKPVKALNKEEIEKIERKIKENDLERSLDNILERAKNVNSLLSFVENLDEVKKASLGNEIKI